MATPYPATFRPYVYRIWNAEGDLLYIGSTIYLGLRMKNHAHHARWWLQAKRFTFEAFATEAEAREAERVAIRTEFPRWNIRERSPQHPDGRALHYMHILANYPDDCRWKEKRRRLIAEKCAA